jgi:hypothetical protein
VNIVTLAEGDITHLHVGLEGTMNALFLKDLADKTRRRLRGRVELGKSGGGLCYGYRVRRATHDGMATGEWAPKGVRSPGSPPRALDTPVALPTTSKYRSDGARHVGSSSNASPSSRLS